MTMTRHSGWTLALALAALPAGAQTLYKCKQLDGRTAYQAEKCAEGARESKIQSEQRPPPAASVPAAPAKATPPGPGARPPEPSPLVQAVGAYPACAQLVPGFSERFGAAYRRLEQRNAESLANLRAAPAVREQIERSGSELREKARTPAGLDMVKRTCESMGTGLDGVGLR